ncbi:hypothetical protein BC833DRAFT_394809 [Globomyces pollinis-pini]|nr:hypothetical protein BC833DRAFT_394809 [Globomyces pollinis-pini]KAJ2993868.1 hypothetical protein HDV02_002035 [Globomyces sp. JEL0801]
MKRQQQNQGIPDQSDQESNGEKQDEEQEERQEWTPQMTTVFLQAVVQFRPCGIHRHFRLLSVRRFLSAHMGTTVSLSQLKLKLEEFYDCHTLNQLSLNTTPIGFELSDFTLPFEDYDDLMDKRRKADIPSPVDSPLLEKSKKLIKPKKSAPTRTRTPRSTRKKSQA